MQLLIDGHHGIFIPQLFCKYYVNQFEGIDKEDIKTCLDPNSEYYWDSWSNILDNAYIVQDGKKFYLYQDMDLFLVEENEEVEIC